MDRLPKLAAELVARKPELIFAPPTPTAVAAKRATQTIPIVFGPVADPVGIGLVTSLARPGGNVTGISNISAALGPKRVELLREILPSVKRIGLLGDAANPTTKAEQQALVPLAASLGLTFVIAEARIQSSSTLRLVNWSRLESTPSWRGRRLLSTTCARG